MDACIPIALCFDESYANFAAVATFSAQRSSASPLKIYWVFPREVLPRVAALQRTLGAHGIEVEPLAVDADRFAGWSERHHISRASYLRLLLPDLLPHSRAIYLDCDLLVLSDLGPLYAVELGHARVAGVTDPRGASTSRIPRPEGDPYLNSGVLLLDLEGMRQDGFLREAEGIRHAHADALVWLDQCILNKYAQGRKLELDERWNRLIYSNETREAEFRELARAQRSSVLHFAGQIKPWHGWSHPCLSECWWDTARQVGIAGLQPVGMTSVDQALLLMKTLDADGRHEESSTLKTAVIANLIRWINANAPGASAQESGPAAVLPSLEPLASATPQRTTKIAAGDGPAA